MQDKWTWHPFLLRSIRIHDNLNIIKYPPSGSTGFCTINPLRVPETPVIRARPAKTGLWGLAAPGEEAPSILSLAPIGNMQQSSPLSCSLFAPSIISTGSGGAGMAGEALHNGNVGPGVQQP